MKTVVFVKLSGDWSLAEMSAARKLFPKVAFEKQMPIEADLMILYGEFAVSELEIEAAQMYPTLSDGLGHLPLSLREKILFGRSGDGIIMAALEIGEEDFEKVLLACYPALRYAAHMDLREQPGAYVYAVNISERKGTVKREVPSIKVRPEWGIEGDAHAGNWHRQISLLAEESIDEMRRQVRFRLINGVFAENINTVGIDLKALPVGTILKVADAVLRVTQIGKDCHNDGCAIKRATGSCVMPTEGIFAEVVEPGTIRAGDPIQIL